MILDFSLSNRVNSGVVFFDREYWEGNRVWGSGG